MFKFILWALKVGPKIIYSYFAWMIKYSRNPKKYPLEKRYAAARDLVFAVLKTMKPDVSIEGYEHLINLKEKSLIISNHQSMVDIMLLISLSKEPITFVAKAETAKMPFVGKILKALEGEFLQRDDPRQSVEVLKRASDKIKNGYCHVAIYPEGHRNKDPFGPFLPFHAGSFKPAFWNKSPILYFAEFGTFNVMDTKVTWKKYPIFVKIFKPVTFEDYGAYTTTDYAPVVSDILYKEIENERIKYNEYIDKGLNKTNFQKGKVWWKVLGL